jgi:hypothetical protein
MDCPLLQPYLKILGLFLRAVQCDLHLVGSSFEPNDDGKLKAGCILSVHQQEDA